MNKKCQTCTKIFRVKPSRVAMGRGKFCSRACRVLPLEEKSCSTCSSLFVSPVRGKLRNTAKFCSHDCYAQSKLGAVPWNRGRRYKNPKLTGQNAHNWSGDLVGYRGVHRWMIRTFGTPDTCEFCEKKATGIRMQWANLTSLYLRDRNDWLRLCVKCHRFYDNFRRENRLIAVTA